MSRRSRAERLRADPDAPELWTGASLLVDPRDPKLRLRAQSLVQTRSTDADKALAVYTFVRRLPVTASLKLGLRTAREVLERGHGDAVDKATLLLALLRTAGLSARVRFAAASREVLRGLPMDVCSMPRPFVEVFTGARWVCTDTYIFDSAYLAAARQRLRRRREECGYGIHAEGATLWESHRDAYLLGPDSADDLLAGSAQAWRDPLEFVRSLPRLQRAGLALRQFAWNVAAPRLQRTLEAVRAEARRRHRSQQARARPDSGRKPRSDRPADLLGPNTAALWS